MKAMTCQEVQEQLDLLAAGECTAALRATLEEHLHTCPTCAARHAESQRLLALLDLHWSQRGIERLQQRIEEQAHRKKRRFLPAFIQRAVAVAAMLLLMVGMLWLPSGRLDREEQESPLALLVQVGKDRPGLELAPAPAVLKGPARAKPSPSAERKGKKNGDNEVVITRPSSGRIGKAHRAELFQAQRAGQLPPPPAVPLELTLINSSKHSVEVQLGGAAARLSLSVQGVGVVRLPAVQAPEPEFLHPRTLQLEPGQQYSIYLERLVAGSPGHLLYVYLTEPGEYQLTPRLRLLAGGQPTAVTGETVRIRVK